MLPPSCYLALWRVLHTALRPSSDLAVRKPAQAVLSATTDVTQGLAA